MRADIYIKQRGKERDLWEWFAGRAKTNGTSIWSQVSAWVEGMTRAANGGPRPPLPEIKDQVHHA